MIDIFINYRTSDEPVAALLIDQALTARLGKDRVFRDNRSIRLGTAFPPEIESALRECRALLAVIGTRWLDRDTDGNRRIDDADDWTRREIATALRRNVKVIPILVGEANLPEAADLPKELADLRLRQYRTLRLRGMEHDVEQLTDDLLDALGIEAPRADEPRPSGGTTIHNSFHAPVEAPGGVFGAVINR